MSEALLGQTQEGRENVVLEAKSRLAFRSGNYALIPAYKGQKVRKNTNTELGNFDSWVLFDLAADHFQEHDLAEEQPALLDSLKASFLDIVGTHYDYDITAIMKQTADQKPIK